MTATSKYSVDITIRHPAWPAMQSEIEAVAFKTLELAGHRKAAELSIVLADDPFVQNLNDHYRHQDKPTNVLSFPADDPFMLGDVILAYETVKKESETQGKDFDHHVIHLIIHGILHLVGYDHENDDDAETMETLEIRILEAFGVKNPYEPADY